MPFELWTRVGPRNHVLGGFRDPSGKGAIFRVPPSKMHCSSESAENGYISTDSIWPQQYTGVRSSFIDTHLHLCEKAG